MFFSQSRNQLSAAIHYIEIYPQSGCWHMPRRAQHIAGFYFIAAYNARLAAPWAASSPSFSDPLHLQFKMRPASPVSDDVCLRR
jgi:hypothetical protein